MPAGVSWGRYSLFSIAALLAMLSGSQVVHLYYKPLSDIDKYIEEEKRKLKGSKI
ncbi:ubiquinol-cytochrome-c reductase complex assembly factor 6 [Diorhabda carinulata]|uniref:ubiquinol-cytochrome-c reductase complex assembly factor 6 n=1 Tax=Diorhabda carinulata TaxID=1163345 RepID=UPI0025A07F4A|nr:ubiquinol-cytochrome-c reductase complex assembly factor 6 [Diorhabda carinulata]